jgi:hypothetical protein
MLSSLKIANRLLPLSALQPYQKIHLGLSRSRLAELHNEIQQFYDPQARLSIVFPPSLDWSEQLFQRPQQMAAVLAKQGVRVFYFQHREHWQAQHFREIQPGLVLCNTPVEVFWELPGQNLYTYAMTWNCRSALAPNIQGVIYDFVDQLSVFPGSQRRLASDHAALTRQASLVLATSERLLEQVRKARPEALLCPNGVDYEHFCQARRPDLPVPDDLKALVNEGKPLAGYVGALARWLDYDLLEATAVNRPDWHIVLIGPDHDQTLPDGLRSRVNVHWIGAKPYQDLPAYLKTFSAALIPFKLNPITHATSPVKLYEYLAAGKPVISTPIHEATHLPEVLLAQSAEEFSACLDKAGELSNNPEYLSRLDQIARQNTWDRRARQIIETLPHEPQR